MKTEMLLCGRGSWIPLCAVLSGQLNKQVFVIAFDRLVQPDSLVSIRGSALKLLTRAC